MSGGSYEYLSYKDPEDLVESQDQIQAMADRLAELGYADDAAKETQNLLLTIRAYHNRIAAMQERLSEVWHEIEWWDSGDRVEDDVKKALAKYRGEK